MTTIDKDELDAGRMRGVLLKRIRFLSIVLTAKINREFGNFAIKNAIVIKSVELFSQYREYGKPVFNEKKKKTGSSHGDENIFS